MSEKERNRKKELGEEGEKAARKALERSGWEVLDQNWERLPLGELDLVGRKGNLVAFVEVRSASTHYLESPSMTVDVHKQSKLVRMAQLYLQEHRLWRVHTRFDVMAVHMGPDELRVEWIEDAFRPPPTARAAVYR